MYVSVSLLIAQTVWPRSSVLVRLKVLAMYAHRLWVYFILLGRIASVVLDAFATDAGGYVAVTWVRDYRRWWVYDGIPYQLKQRTGDRGITAEIWKSRSIPISTKIRLMKALVWPVATYGCESWTPGKNEESRRLDAFEMKGLRKILWVSWTAKKTNEWVLNKAVEITAIDTVKARKLAYYGDIMKKQGSCLEKEIMQGTMPGARCRVRPRTTWMDIKTGQDFPWKSQSEWQRTDINGERCGQPSDRGRLKNRTEQLQMQRGLCVWPPACVFVIHNRVSDTVGVWSGPSSGIWTISARSA